MMRQYATGLVCALTLSVYGDVVTYECTAFPEEEGFTREDVLFPAERWLDGGWVYQFTQIAGPGPPAESEQDIYRRSIAEYAGAEHFFVEWVVESDGPRTGIPNVSPSALVAGGRSGIAYHFTVAADQVRYIDSDLNVYLIDIDPGVPHTYRIELHPTEDLWFIDGKLILTAAPAGPYPTSDSVIVWGARAGTDGETTRWDYIRYGTIPSPGSGDYDSDSDLDWDDLYFFTEHFSGPGFDAGPGAVWGDFDLDTDVDLSDFAAFQNAFTGGE